jgi:DNA-binding SARP family transcriptional activator
MAERAIDDSRTNPGSRAVVEAVMMRADPENTSHQIALGRALLAGGQALAWTGTETSIVESRREFRAAAEIFADLGRTDWQGSALLRCGYSAYFQYGDLAGAEPLMRAAINIYAPGQRRNGALPFYADVLIDMGEFDRADEVVQECFESAQHSGDANKLPEAVWSMARIAAGRGDPRRTERLLREAERLAEDADWFVGHVGGWFLTEAAEMLDRVGLPAEANRFYERALEQSRAYTAETDAGIVQARAMLTARSGDPLQALEQLQEIVRSDWLEKRLVWRHELMRAWATFRAGREGAGPRAAQAFATAARMGGGDLRVALAGERELTVALAPLAEAAGDGAARRLLLDGRELLIRLFGTPSVTRPDGSTVELPAGKPGELTRILALHPDGLPVDVVLDWFFGDTPLDAARQRLRQILTRLRAAAGEIVVRDGNNLRLIRAWIDVSEFESAGNRVRTSRGPQAVQLAYAAVALRSGPLLPSDPYADWVQEARDRIDARYLELLDLIAADADARQSHQEALTALEQALASDPDDARRQQAMVDQLRALGRTRAAEHHERQIRNQR